MSGLTFIYPNLSFLPLPFFYLTFIYLTKPHLTQHSFTLPHLIFLSNLHPLYLTFNYFVALLYSGQASDSKCLPIRPFRQILEDARFSPVRAGTGPGTGLGPTCDGRLVIFGAQVRYCYCTPYYCIAVHCIVQYRVVYYSTYEMIQ